MHNLTEQDIHIVVYTFKDGIAARLAHDLKLRVSSVKCTITPTAGDPFSVKAIIDPTRIFVDCARVDGHDDHDALKPADRDKINHHIQDDVLLTRKFRDIQFLSTRVKFTGNAFDITGNLTLCGHTHSIHLIANRRGDHYVTSTHINQPDYGIKPYAAPFGVLKIKPGVVVEISFPAIHLDPSEWVTGWEGKPV